MDSHERESVTEKLHFADPRSPVAELPHAVSEALNDPIVQTLMAADGINREGVEELMRRVIARLSAAGAQNDLATPHGMWWRTALGSAFE